MYYRQKKEIKAIKIINLHGGAMTSYSTVFLVLDIQNDLCHQDGVFHKHGLATPHNSNIIPNIINTMNFCNQLQIPIIATQLTILVNTNNEAIGLGAMHNLRPFLEKEGFRENTWGHDLLEGLPSVTYKIRKWGFSAFYETELNQYLKALGATELVLSGFTTNGVVETVAREALSRNFQIITLTDCVASYSDALHQASLSNLASMGQIIKSDEWQNRYKETI
jgi:ureidoacrylate peracid hydrolase